MLEAGAAFVKTSTGFSSGGARLDDVRLMVKTVGGRCEVKAFGGVRDLASARAMLGAGATRLGTSNGVKIVSGRTRLRRLLNGLPAVQPAAFSSHARALV